MEREAVGPTTSKDVRGAEGSEPGGRTLIEQATNQARASLMAGAEEVKDQVRAGTEAVREGLSSAAEDAKKQAVDIASQAKERAYGLAEEQKQVGVEGIGSIAKAVHSAADELEDTVPGIARYVHDAASSIDSVSHNLKQKTVDDLVGTVEHFARTQPVAFFGTAVLAGFALSRFVKSSNERRAAIEAKNAPPSAGPGREPTPVGGFPQRGPQPPRPAAGGYRPASPPPPPRPPAPAAPTRPATSQAGSSAASSLARSSGTGTTSTPSVSHSAPSASHKPSGSADHESDPGGGSAMSRGIGSAADVTGTPSSVPGGGASPSSAATSSPGTSRPHGS
jgi:hypothetical protein